MYVGLQFVFECNTIVGKQIADRFAQILLDLIYKMNNVSVLLIITTLLV